MTEPWDEPRDPDRIPRICDALERYWTAHPDRRLGQIVANAYSDAGHHGGDPFHMEDDVLEQYLERKLEGESDAV